MKKLSAASEVIVKTTLNLSAALLAISLLLILYQVFTRFVLGDSATWTEILTRGLIIWMVFLVAGAGFRLGAMISLKFLFNRLSARPRKVVAFLVMGLTLASLCLLVWYGAQMAIRVQNQSVAMLNIPMTWLYAAIPVGAFCAIPGVLLSYFSPVADDMFMDNT